MIAACCGRPTAAFFVILRVHSDPLCARNDPQINLLDVGRLATAISSQTGSLR